MVDRRRVLHSLLIGAAGAMGAAGFGAAAFLQIRAF